MDKLVEIARFTYPAEAQTLMALLRAVGIECFLRNEYSSQIMAGYVDIGGARVEILESDVPLALEVMKKEGYDIPEKDEETAEILEIGGWARHIPFLKKYPLEKQFILLFVFITLFLAFFITLGYFLSLK